jgi:hypothetical protein
VLRCPEDVKYTNGSEFVFMCMCVGGYFTTLKVARLFSMRDELQRVWEEMAVA